MRASWPAPYLARRGWTTAPSALAVSHRTESMTRAPNGRYPRVGDYALVGDCHSAALIARDGSIDWYCPQRFDGGAVSCRLLDADKGGYLRSAPTQTFSVERWYVGTSNVLETTFRSNRGRLRLTDLMPVYAPTSERRGYDVGASNHLFRQLECLDGSVDVEVQFKPGFDCARARSEMEPRHRAGAIARTEDATAFLRLAYTRKASILEPAGAVHRGGAAENEGDRQIPR